MTLTSLPGIKALIIDMDGVLWRESSAIGDLPTIFARFDNLGLKTILATNNGTRTPQQYVDKLKGFGLDYPADQILTSAMGAAHILKKRFPQGGPVYIMGEIGLQNALEDEGFHQSEKNPVAVIGGMDREVSFTKLRTATLLLRAGVPFYFTNPDRTYPTPKGLIPGAGALLAALEVASDVNAIVVGKPSPILYEFALERLGTLPGETLAVGDRLETDILGGQRAGCKTALVLSGVATRQDATNWQPPVDLVIDELSDLQ
jgi:4-nitrophenyl phosphatase